MPSSTKGNHEKGEVGGVMSFGEGRGGGGGNFPIQDISGGSKHSSNRVPVIDQEAIMKGIGEERVGHAEYNSRRSERSGGLNANTER